MDNKQSALKTNINDSIEVTISLTTTSYRINKLKKTLKSIFNQTYLPKKILLNLSEDEYLLDKGIKKVPNYLKKLESKGLIQINFTDNIGPYRKLLPALKLTNNIIVTIDDDIWFRASSITKNISVIKIHNNGLEELPNIKNTQKEGLWENINKYKNDEILKNVFDYFNIDVNTFK